MLSPGLELVLMLRSGLELVLMLSSGLEPVLMLSPGLELVLMLSSWLELGGWEPAGAQARRGHSLFFVNDGTLGEMPGSPYPSCSLKGYGIWKMCHLQLSLFTSAWMTGPLLAPRPRQRPRLRHLGRCLVWAEVFLLWAREVSGVEAVRAAATGIGPLGSWQHCVPGPRGPDGI